MPVVVATALLGTLSLVAVPVLIGITESPDRQSGQRRSRPRWRRP